MNAYSDPAMLAALCQAIGADFVNKTFPATVDMETFVAMRKAGFSPVVPEPKETPDAN